MTAHALTRVRKKFRRALSTNITEETTGVLIKNM